MNSRDLKEVECVQLRERLWGLKNSLGVEDIQLGGSHEMRTKGRGRFKEEDGKPSFYILHFRICGIVT